MTPLVLIHGGGLDSRCWERLHPLLDGPALAVDLPGRGAHPARLEDVNFAACASTVVADIDAAGFDEVVLVAHSLAGCSMPAIVDALGARVRHACFVACTVPDDGTSAFDMLDADIQERIRSAGPIEPRPMDPEMARIVLGNDLSDEEFGWCVERLVAEAPRLTTDPVDLAPFAESTMTRSWVRTLDDMIVPAANQLRYAQNVGDCPVIDLEAGHICMVSRPEAFARILDELVAD